MALEVFRKIQVGLEGDGTPGTLVSADRRLHGTLTMTPEIAYHMPQDERGSRAMHKRSVATRHGMTARFQGDATYEEINYFLATMLVEPVVSTPGSATNARQYLYQQSLVGANDRNTMSLEFGDETQEWESAFVVCQSLELQIQMGEVVGLSADLIGHFPAKSTFTSVTESAVVNEIISGGAKLWIDTTFANLGTTAFTAMLVGGSIRINGGFQPIRFAEGVNATTGQSNFSTLAEVRTVHNMTLDMALSSDAVTQIYDAYVAGTNRAGCNFT